MMPREIAWRKASVAAIIMFLLAGWAYLFRGVAPMLWQTVFLPGAVLTLAILFAPPTMRPGMRLLLTTAVLVLLYLTTHLAPGPFPQTEINVVTALWAIGQIALVIVSARIDTGTAGPLAHSFSEQGYFATLWKMRQGAFGLSIAGISSASKWACAILIVSSLLWRSDALEYNEQSLFAMRAFGIDQSGRLNNLVITLTTPDNNPQKYLRAALTLCRTLHEAGAVVTCFPRRGSLDSISEHLADSIAGAGGLTFIQPLPAETHRFFSVERPGLVARYQAIDISWRSGKPIFHPGLIAAARFLKAPVRVPPKLLQNPLSSLSKRISLLDAGEWPTAKNTSVWIGEKAIPIWSDGSSAVLASHWVPPTWVRPRDRLTIPLEFEITDWDSGMTFFSYESGNRTHSLPDSIWKRAGGKMVFVQWINKGEDIRRDDAAGPAMVADMVVRGFMIDRGGHWHLAVSFLVLLLGIALFARARVWILVAAMAGCAIGLLIIDGWVFREYLYVANLIYPAFCAGLAAVIMPLVSISRRQL